MGSRFNYLTSDGPAACAIERRPGYRVYSGKVNGADEDVMRAVSESGDEAALMTRDERHADELFGFALNRLRDRRLAEDFVQDVFVRVWSRADACDVERGNFRPWPYRIARDHLTDLKRRRRVRPELAREIDAPSSADEIDDARAQWQVRPALERLSPAHREVIRLVRIEALSVREAAAGGRAQPPVNRFMPRTS